MSLRKYNGANASYCLRVTLSRIDPIPRVTVECRSQSPTSITDAIIAEGSQSLCGKESFSLQAIITNLCPECHPTPGSKNDEHGPMFATRVIMPAITVANLLYIPSYASRDVILGHKLASIQSGGIVCQFSGSIALT